MEHKLLVDEQFGFREQISTDSAIFDLLNSVLFSLDNKHLVGGLFCDLQKAFDCVNHRVLLGKLEFYGITGLENKLFKSYLSNRFQRVIIRNKVNRKTTSTWRIMENGVPQGSVLGPLLFLVYINDLAKIITDVAKPILFADDTSIIIEDSNPDEFSMKLDLVVNQTVQWFQCNLLSVNYAKTHFLQFLTKQQKALNIQIVVSNSIISNVNTTKFLGLIIDKDLSWKDHILDLKQKLDRACYAIRATKPFMSQCACKIIYHSYFHSVMSYGIIFWGNSHASRDIFKVQKRVIRILSNKTKNDSCRLLFKQLQILTLPSQYIYSLLSFVVKNRNLFTANFEIHKVYTRTMNNFHLPLVNLSMTQKGVLYSGSRLFNILPIRLKGLSDDIKLFRRELRSFLLEHTLHSLDEFYQATSNDKL